jgi:hypothetical protein
MAERGFETKMWGRWVGTFIGFPLAGVAARLAAGNIDAASAAVIGGLVGGATLGAFQSWIGGLPQEDRVRWAGATAAGLAVGLAAGASTVGYRTDTASLMAMGAISGAVVGLAQAISVPMPRVDRVLWALATPILWAGGWLVTSQIIVDAERQHAMFGGPGSAAVAAVAGVLYAYRARPTQSTVALVGTSSDRGVA